ncbi:hypothetical protein TNCV_2483701 [Trichonephila clavipes]|uniref:Uncharacterized protein n=1 Tax=Trichonephila clavipes TaxID=2585209 RepID=A0A8X7BC20_TRICX|nr:hypothetical protein TNCV_2483701 [Trichonephila clavipes]
MMKTTHEPEPQSPNFHRLRASTDLMDISCSARSALCASKTRDLFLPWPPRSRVNHLLRTKHSNPMIPHRLWVSSLHHPRNPSLRG